MKVSIIVPFRDDGSRLPQRNFVLRRWRELLPDAEIVEGHDEGEPFSKSTAVNEAFMRSSGDVLIVSDADTWMEEKLDRTIEIAAASGCLVIPWTKMHRLNEEDSRAVMDGSPVTDEMKQRVITTSPAPYTAGGLFAISSAAFRHVNGMDPRFRGWGHEDISFRRACDTLLGRTQYLRSEIFALWHPRPMRNGRVWGPNDPGGLNLALNGAYMKAERRPDAMRQLVDQHPLGEAPQPLSIPAAVRQRPVPYPLIVIS